MDPENTSIPVPGQPSPAPVSPVPDRKGLAVASLVLGIVSLALFCLAYISFPCAVLGIVFGAISRQSSRAGMAKAGLICSIVAVALDILAITLLASFFASIWKWGNL